LDFLANNTDRKAGHCLLSKWGRIYGIDHGLCFSTEFKLRTVIWDFAGERIDNDLIKAIEGAGTQLSGTVTKWLAPDEQLAVLHRAEILLNSGLFPEDDGYRWPWPLI
jgi:Phosphatidylinositol 3- and 4-kinase.